MLIAIIIHSFHCKLAVVIFESCHGIMDIRSLCRSAVFVSVLCSEIRAIWFFGEEAEAEQNI